jgi:hypothetical protein
MAGNEFSKIWEEREMKSYNLRNRVYSMNLIKLKKLKALCIITLFIISILSVFWLNTVQAAPGNLFSDSFQSGSFSSWSRTDGSPIIVTSPVHGGDNYAAKFVDTASWNSIDCLKSIGAQSTIYTSLYFQISALPSQSTGLDLVNYYSGSNLIVRVGIYNWNGVYFFLSVRGSEVEANVAPSSNAWHYLQIGYDNTNNVQSVWLDGTRIISSNIKAASTVDMVNVGIPLDMGIKANVFVDDVMVNSDNSISAPSTPTSTPTPTPKPTSTATPIPTPTPKPTATPTATPSSSNLASIPNANYWSYPNSGGWSINNPWTAGGYASKNYYQYPVVKAGQTAIQLLNDPALIANRHGSNSAELDGPLTSVNIGDVVTFSAWIWMDKSSIGDTNPSHGGAFGVDMYGSGGRICQIDYDSDGIVRPDYIAGCNTYPYSGGYDNSNLMYVPFGTGGWVHRSFSFTVANTYQQDGFGNTIGTVVKPTGFVAWFDIVTKNPTSEMANMWIYGTELYITH